MNTAPWRKTREETQDTVHGFLVDNILAMFPIALSDCTEYAFPPSLFDDSMNYAMLDVLAADWEGIYQPQTLYKIFDIEEGCMGRDR